MSKKMSAGNNNGNDACLVGEIIELIGRGFLLHPLYSNNKEHEKHYGIKVLKLINHTYKMTHQVAVSIAGNGRLFLESNELQHLRQTSGFYFHFNLFVACFFFNFFYSNRVLRVILFILFCSEISTFSKDVL